MFTTERIAEPRPPGQPGWPELRARLLRDLERDETRWQRRLVNATSERAEEIAESVLSDVWFVQSTLEEATGPLPAWRRLEGMRAGRCDLPAWISDVMARLSEGLYGPVVGLGLDEECSRG